MISPTSLPIVVIGAGALGAATALAVARAGASVILIDEAPLGRNASGVAAGMLAPAMESALDPVSAGRFALLSAARDLWPQFVEGLGPTGLERCGAFLKAEPGLVDQACERLRGQGASAQRVEPGVLFTTEDWRIEPRLALAAMLEDLYRLGGEVRWGRVHSIDDGAVVFEDGATLEAEAIVLACGFGGQHLTPALAVLEPIKGQILRYPDVEMIEGPILRGAGGYVVPSRDRPLCGARPQANAGVRATTPDGLPMVGRAGEAGVWLAAGARRDGWLLAPMIAVSLVRQIVHGAGPEPAFDPSRFAV